MSRSIVFIFGACVFLAHSAAHRIQDATLKRIVRSPHYGSSYHHDDFDTTYEHSPPPILYHTQNWSGIAKGLGGAPQGVFSGAAASAQSSAPDLSEAFSIAASGSGPVTSDEQGQVKQDLVKSGFGGNSNYGGSETQHSSFSFGNKYGRASSGFGSSEEGQHNIESSGLELGGRSSGSQFSAGTRGIDTAAAGDVSTSYGRSSGHIISDFDGGQRNINSGFSGKGFESDSTRYGSRPSQHMSSKAFGHGANRGDIGSGSLTNEYPARGASEGFEGQSEQENLQTSNKRGSDGYNWQSDNFDAGLGFIGRSLNEKGDSSNQFRQHNGQSSEYGNQRGGASRAFESHGGYGEFENYGGFDGRHSNHHDIHRQSKSYHNNEQFGNQGSAGQGFGDNGLARSTEFSNFQSSPFRNSYSYGSGGPGAGHSGNSGQLQQSRKLDGDFSSSQAVSQDFSGAHNLRQSDQLNAGFSASQTGSPVLSGGQSQSSSGASGSAYKQSGGLISENKGALAVNNANGEISPGSEHQSGSHSANAGHEDVESTYGSALNLASQGLQTAQKTPCNTCDKGSYALSNAKSHSGSAIALSIGG